MKKQEFLGITEKEVDILFTLLIQTNNKPIGYIDKEYNNLPHESKIKILLDISSWVNSEILKIKQ